MLCRSYAAQCFRLSVSYEALKIYLELQVPPALAAVDPFNQRLPYRVELVKVVHLQTQNVLSLNRTNKNS